LLDFSEFKHTARNRHGLWQKTASVHEWLHLDRTGCHRVLAIPHLINVASGILNGGWKITRFEVFTKVGGPLYLGEVGSASSFMVLETADQLLFLFRPLNL
jgi:hypothetical protein